jgi:elongation factor Ts
MMEKIKKIREITGAGVVDIKKALDEAGGEESMAVEILRKKGLEKANKKDGRETKEGTIGFYVHMTGKVASWVKLYCETDFVAKNDEFQQLAKDLAMQVTAMSPMTIKPEDVSKNIIEEQREEWKKEIKGKPDEIVKKIMSGKEEKFRKENSLLGQNFIKDQNVSVGEHVKSIIAKVGENIQVGDIGRIEL